ncbi:hypothetical protein RUND412_011440, partial [Rhizina undulata]
AQSLSYVAYSSTTSFHAFKVHVKLPFHQKLKLFCGRQDISAIHYKTDSGTFVIQLKLPVDISETGTEYANQMCGHGEGKTVYTRAQRSRYGGLLERRPKLHRNTPHRFL